MKFVLLFVVLWQQVQAAHLLFVSIAGFSAAHQMSSTAAELLKLHPEHTVDYLTYGDAYELVKSKDSRINVSKFAEELMPQKRRDEVMLQLGHDNIKGLGELMKVFASTYAHELKVLKDTIKQKRPDFVVIDFFVAAAIDLMTYEKIPFVSFYHVAVSGIMGIEDPLFAPDFLTGTGKADITLFGRIKKFGNFLWIVRASTDATDLVNDVRRANGLPEFLAPDTNIIRHPILFMTSWALEYSRKVPPSTRVVGFFYDKSDKRMRPTTPDDDKVLAFLNEKPDAKVVYVAFGTEAVPTKRMILEIIHGVHASKMRLVLAIRTNILALNGLTAAAVKVACPDSLLVNWVTQQMVVNEKQVAIFITHGGIASVAESIYANKPMVIIPEGADRDATAARLVDRQVAVRLRPKTLTRDNVKQALDTLLKDYPKTVETLKWIVRVNEEDGGGAPGAAREIQKMLVNGYAHLLPLELELGWWASTSADLVFMILFTPIFLFAFCLGRCVGRRSSIKIKEKSS